MTERTFTYAELAKKLGIKIDSARRLVRRKNWKRTTGNDGTTRISVPVESLPPDNPPDSPPDNTNLPTQEFEIKIARLEAEVTGLNQLVEAERTRSAAAERDRDDWKELALKPWWKRIVG